MTNATVTSKNNAALRRLRFSGAKNFRDLGGYKTLDNKTTRWSLLYRSDALNKLTDTDLKRLSALGLHRVVDFRSRFEKERESDRLPAELLSRVVEIPILDNGTQKFRGSREEIFDSLKQIDSNEFMMTANKDFASHFTPEIRKFIDVLLSSDGKPVLFHCTAGKDRTGFAAAVLLRILGVPHDVVVEDYLLTNKYFLASHHWNLILLRLLRGAQFAEIVRGFMLARNEYLFAAFETIDRTHGSFEHYVKDGLGLTETDVECLRTFYLE